MSDRSPPLLDVHDLTVSFRSAADTGTDEIRFLHAVEDVSLTVPRRASVGIVGESGSGKSVTALSILRLLPEPPARIERGRILFHAAGADPAAPPDLLRLEEKALRRLRGDRIAMIFQEPMTALNPVFSVGDQIGEALRAHRPKDQPMSRREGLDRAAELLQQVGLSDAPRRAREYPHQLSGGQRQRVMIAMALCNRPELLIADEPTTALDVTTQAQILDLLKRLQAELGMSVLFISHDLGVVAEVCQYVAVMYAGQVVEQAPASELFRGPRHPYTAGLLRALPRLAVRRRRLREIPGRVPRLGEMPVGCRFADRCPHVAPRCRAEAPELLDAPLRGGEIVPGHSVRCHFPLDGSRIRVGPSASGGPAFSGGPASSSGGFVPTGGGRAP